MIRLPSITYILQNAKSAFLRFPYVLICAILCAFLSIILVENESTDFWFIKLLMSMGLGIPFFFSLTLYLEKPLPSFKPTSLLLLGGGTFILVGFYFLSSDAPSVNFYLNYAQWALVFHLLAAFSAFLAKGETNGFWQLNRFLFLRFCLSGLYAAVFFVGLALALGAIDHLLDVKIHDKLYMDIWVFAALVFHPWHFLGGLPKKLKELDRLEDYPAALKVFTQFLLVPLVTLYTLILYVYLGKVLVKWDWPKGTVTWLVSSVALAGVFNLLLLYPAQEKKENSWIKIYARGFYLALFPLVTMLFLAVGKRIEQYGVTEQRYFVTALGVWILGIALYFLFGKTRSVKTVPMTLFLIVLATSFGPWGAYSVSRHSQMGRLQGYFEKNGMWKDGKAVKAAKDVAFDDRREISSILDYLVENHGVAPIRKWFELDLSKWDKGETRNRYGYYKVSTEICKSLGINYVSRWEVNKKEEYFRYYKKKDAMALPVGGYDYILEMGWDAKKKYEIAGVQYALTLTKEKVVFGPPGGKSLSFDLGDMLKKIEARAKTEKDKKVSDELLTLDEENASIRCRLVLNSLGGRKKPDGIKFDNPNGFLLVKIKH